MAKTLHSEILAILRKYELAGELTARKEIKNIKEYPERQLSRLISFMFNRQVYHILYDTSAADDVDVVFDHIRLDVPDIKGVLVRNPIEGQQKAYGMPHKGKDVYLLEKLVKKVRLDQELVQRHPDLSRSTIQKYIKNGNVQVNGVVVTKAKYDTTEADEISLSPPEKTNFSQHELPILYIDDDVIVVNKPAGVLTHAKGALSDEFTVADFFRRFTTNALDSSRPGIVHRLDRDTSGVIIGARNDAAAALLKKQFSDRTARKCYAAVVDGAPKLDQAVIDLPIGRNPSAPSTFRVDPKGKSALTEYKVLKSDGIHSLIELKPKTGRTHQLRVHMKYINTPILGDRVYGDVKSAPRLMLHAHLLELLIPNGTRKQFIADIPSEFTNAISEQ